MPANKSNLSTPRKEKPGDKLYTLATSVAANASKKKKRSSSFVKHKHYAQYLQLHSEYRSTYTWHEYTGPHQEHTVVRRAPQPPPSTKQPSAKLQSAKSTEDENSEGPTLEPPLPRRKKCPELAYRTHEFITAADGGGIDAIDSNVVADKVREVTATSALPPSQLSKAISRISTEYRLQFAWPRRPQLTNGETQAPVAAAGFPGGTTGPPRKSLSMGALKQGMVPSGPAPVHKKRPGDFDHKRDGVQASELEPLVGGTGTDMIDGVVPEGDEREEDLSDLKVAFRGKKSGRTVRISDNKVTEKSKARPFPTAEVIELRRLADEYKHRDWGCGLAAEDEASLWKRVSSNHALNALSLARSVTKEEKEKENTRKVAPIATMPPAGRPSSVQARPIHGILQDDTKADTDRAIARARKDFLIRHHLDRTTGVGDGALLPSPTREKLEPVIPRRRDDVKEHRDEIQPRTKSSPKNSPRTGRSQSLGPTVTDRRSPKRQPPRAPSVTKDAKEKEKEMKDKDKEHREKSEPERHPRPMTAEPQVNGDVTGGDSSVASTPPSQTTKAVGPAPVTQASPWLDDEPVVKSPPEPTRVKSPEQMIMRSPEPVNWTVPLDTGKTFTVTQNVREEPLTRPHSEAKTWAPSSVPSAPQSAPPELAAQHKSQHSQHSGYKSPESESVSLGSFSGINGHKDLDSERDSPLPTNAQDTPTKDGKEITDVVEETKERQSPESSIKSVTGTNLRRLEDPTFEMESKREGGIPVAITTAPVTTTSSTSPAPQSYRVLEAESPAQGTGGSSSSTAGTGSSTGGSTAGGYHVLEAPTVVPGSAQRSAATDVLEKARNRFDKFWGKGNNGAEN
ncbi:PREDICTED: muscle M-line assembly protein unc-89 isoform X9 [Trachymyrmex septentrionalis]|uniref:muscle M-line assembly protein unc-89 isoform X9 n=1 Tax=Trachymyrmex septentrionalis TaxID=34720 RepID=UPI00084F83BE|nr:PREDICTED: muscle M-line assembly protein unc-89 isoform X9 [Trachymyrmex septentrionalis]